MKIESGKEYHIVVDAVCPPLNSKEEEYAQGLVLTLVEGWACKICHKLVESKAVFQQREIYNQEYISRRN
jgi:hypothetical protein